jgi:S-DNA-T family DNA segregation ATPase FtsK/SpoIIIE
VKWEADEAGVRLTIFRHGLDGLPEFVAAEEIWKKVPDNKPPLTFTVGYGDNSKRFDVDLDDCPHMIVGGATKQGKSNFINQMICFWLRRGLTPQDLQLVLFDLKRGMEFTFYEGLPHLYKDSEEHTVLQKLYETPTYIKTGIIEELKDVIPALLRLRQIMDERMLHIKSAGYKDFNSFNRAQYSRKNRIPSLVVIFDEWARISLTLGKEPESILAEVAGMARAAGMYFIIGTQNPNGAVISNLISINFQTRIIFKCSSGASQAALYNWSAVGLEERGRCILADGGEQWKIQTPRISDGLIQSIVYKAITGKEKKFGDAMDLEEILQHSLDKLDGILYVDKLYAIFKINKVRYKWLQSALKDAEGKEFVLSGSAYKVSHKGRNKPRKLIPVDKLVPEDK